MKTHIIRRRPAETTAHRFSPTLPKIQPRPLPAKPQVAQRAESNASTLEVVLLELCERGALKALFDDNLSRDPKSPADCADAAIRQMSALIGDTFRLKAGAYDVGAELEGLSTASECQCIGEEVEWLTGFWRKQREFQQARKLIHLANTHAGVSRVLKRAKEWMLAVADHEGDDILKDLAATTAELAGKLALINAVSDWCYSRDSMPAVTKEQAIQGAKAAAEIIHAQRRRHDELIHEDLLFAAIDFDLQDKRRKIVDYPRLANLGRRQCIGLSAAQVMKAVANSDRFVIVGGEHSALMRVELSPEGTVAPLQTPTPLEC